MHKDIYNKLINNINSLQNTLMDMGDKTQSTASAVISTGNGLQKKGLML